jgi:primosomal protein N''
MSKVIDKILKELKKEQSHIQQRIATHQQRLSELITAIERIETITP